MLVAQETWLAVASPAAQAQSRHWMQWYASHSPQAEQLRGVLLDLWSQQAASPLSVPRKPASGGRTRRVKTSFRTFREDGQAGCRRCGADRGHFHNAMQLSKPDLQFDLWRAATTSAVTPSAKRTTKELRTHSAWSRENQSAECIFSLISWKKAGCAQAVPRAL